MLLAMGFMNTHNVRRWSGGPKRTSDVVEVAGFYVQVFKKFHQVIVILHVQNVFLALKIKTIYYVI